MRRFALVALAAATAAAVGCVAPRVAAATEQPATDRWAACARVDVRVDLAGAPAGALADVERAIASIDTATGLRLRYAGPTALVPSGTNWRRAHVISVSWSAPGATDLLAGDNAGEGGYAATGGTITSGFVVLDTRYNGLPAGFGRGGTRGALLLHELGHAVGLQHSADPRDVMYPSIGTGPAAWSSGDRAALARVGCR